MSYSIRKFFETAVADAESGGGGTATLEQPIIEAAPQQQSIAALMAKSGQRVTNDSPAAKPIVNTVEKQEEPKKAENGTVATTTTSNAGQANQESQTPKVEEPIIVTPPIAETIQEVQPTWQEVLKSQQPDIVLKELGFDDKTVKILNELKGFDKIDFFTNLIGEWKKNGNVNGYLKELSTDYSKMPSEEVMRHQLQMDYPKASPKQIEALYKKEIVEAYNLDSEDTDLAEEGKLLLDAKADRFRDKLTENQQNFLFPKAPEAKPIEPDLQEQESAKQIEAYKSAIDNDPYSKNVFQSKQIVIGTGEEAFKFPIDPDHIKSLLNDSDKWTATQFDIIKNPDGSVKSVTPKVETQMLTAAFASNPKLFLDEYAKHFKALGGKSAIEPLNNAKPPEGVQTSNTQAKPTNPAEAMAKGGVRVTGG